MKYKQPIPEFELRSLCLFLTTLTITPRAHPLSLYIYIYIYICTIYSEIALSFKYAINDTTIIALNKINKNCYRLKYGIFISFILPFLRLISFLYPPFTSIFSFIFLFIYLFRFVSFCLPFV